MQHQQVLLQADLNVIFRIPNGSSALGTEHLDQDGISVIETESSAIGTEQCYRNESNVIEGGGVVCF